MTVNDYLKNTLERANEVKKETLAKHPNNTNLAWIAKSAVLEASIEMLMNCEELDELVPNQFPSL